MYLQLAVSSWQKHQSAWAASTNAHIDQMNAHASANAAQIKENARKARKDLENTMASWDHKVAKFRTGSANARSKLSAQFAAQGKATSAWANNKIKGLVASTAAQFNDVESKMAKNRAEVDGALKAAVMRFAAALNAQKAEEKMRVAQVGARMHQLKSETEAKVKQMESGFKTQLISLSSTVKEQVSKVNSRIDDAAATVRSDQAAQAKVNSNVNAEMSRMIKLGNDRYKKHLVNNMKMQNKISADQAETDEKINKMAMAFNAALAGVRKQLKKDRAHAEGQLQKQTSAVWDQLKKNQAMQAHKNAAMKAEIRRVRLDAMDALRKVCTLLSCRPVQWGIAVLHVAIIVWRSLYDDSYVRRPRRTSSARSTSWVRLWLPTTRRLTRRSRRSQALCTRTLRRTGRAVSSWLPSRRPTSSR